MRDILDDNEIIEQDDSYQLKQAKFLKSIRLFSIISLVNAIFLALLTIGFIVYAWILLEKTYTNEGEVAMCFCAGFFSFIGSFLLFQTYKNNNRFAKNPDDISFLSKGMNYFFGFWLALIFNFIFMGFVVMIWG